MDQPLTIELSEKALANLEKEALMASKPPDKFAAESLEERFNYDPPSLTQEQGVGESDSFSRFIGYFKTDQPIGLDNEQIDADLARKYGDDHKNCECCSD